MEAEPLYQHESNGSPDRYVLDRTQQAHDSWKAAGTPLFRAFYNSDVVPIYMFEGNSPDRYYYSPHPDGAGPGWTNRGVAFYAFNPALSQPPNTVAVYQHKATNPDRFFFSLNEQDGVNYGWSVGDLLCYATPEN